MDTGSASRPIAGEIVCGDAALIVSRGEETMVALADGLGHGPEAFRAAQAAVAFVGSYSGRVLERLIADCGRAIADTRGAALTVLRIDRSAGRFGFVGVGNVEMKISAKSHARAVNSPGIVGRRAPRKILVSEHELAPGDVIALFSDGISSRFLLEDYRGMAAQKMAEAILAEHGKEHDDASCIVVRY